MEKCSVSRFRLYYNNGKISVWWQRDKQYLENVLFVWGSIMVRAGIHLNGRTNLVVFANGYLTTFGDRGGILKPNLIFFFE